MKPGVTLPIDSDLILLATHVFGATAQAFVAVEECAEFTKALMKFENRGGSVSDLINETADALFLLMQMRVLLGEQAVDEALVNTQEKLREKISKVEVSDEQRR